jgi:hypothetical protein
MYLVISTAFSPAGISSGARHELIRVELAAIRPSAVHLLKTIADHLLSLLTASFLWSGRAAAGAGALPDSRLGVYPRID